MYDQSSKKIIRDSSPLPGYRSSLFVKVDHLSLFVRVNYMCNRIVTHEYVFQSDEMNLATLTVDNVDSSAFQL